MDVVHVVNEISGESIAIEIATEINQVTDVNVSVVPINKPEEPLPDTLPSSLVDTDLSTRRYRDLVRDLEQRGTDIVHTHNNRSAAGVGLIASGSGLTHVNTQHGHIHYTILQKGLNLVTLATADHIVYNSSATKDSYNYFERVLKSGAAGPVIYNGVDLERIKPFTVDIESVDTAVTATRLIPRKNLDRVVEAIARIDDLSLKLVGDGPARADLEQRATEYGVADRVEFLGYVPNRADVYAALSTGEVFVLPSHSEGFCVAVAEAMAIGLPVVVSDIPVFHEVVGEYGVFVDETSVTEIATGIQSLRAEPEEARARGTHLQERIASKFSLARTATEYENTYERVLAQGVS